MNKMGYYSELYHDLEEAGFYNQEPTEEDYGPQESDSYDSSEKPNMNDVYEAVFKKIKLSVNELSDTSVSCLRDHYKNNIIDLIEILKSLQEIEKKIS